ncbi:long tail fiber distal subunit [Vibrio phage vB_ValM_R11Z]|nr:long tail fiber distal subunit [Vibrio phage vB_ValM_R11Z]
MAKLGPTNIFGTLNVSSMAQVGSLVVDTELFAQNTQKVFHDAYHPNADKWTTARTLNLSGDASGSVSWDGSSDVTLNVTVADDSHTHETQYISKTQPYNDNILSGSIGGSDGKPLLQVNGASAYLGSTGRAGLQLATSTNPEWVGGGGAYKLFNDAYHPNADKWTNARTLTLSGDLSGSVSIDGSSNVTLSASVANDSHTHTWIVVDDTRDTPITPNTLVARSVSAQFTNLDRPGGFSAWYSALSVNGWDSGYQAWQLLGGSNNFSDNELYFRRGLTTSWSSTQRIFMDDYHPNADRWTTSRTLTLNGDASGSVSINGSSNVTLTVTVANDSHTHDGRYYTESESNSRYVYKSGDTMTGNLTFKAGSHAGAVIKALDGGANGTNLIFSPGGNLVIGSGESTAANAVLSGNTGEDLHAGSDGTIFMYTNAQTWGSRKTYTLSTTGDFTAPGNITAYSDIRIKTDIKRIVNPLEKIDSLNGYTYERTDIDGPRQTGVIAQEVIEVLPEAVVEQNNMYSVSYGNMVGLLIEGIKEEKRKREELEKRLESLEKLLK